jgi:MinD superfamily P-loop ATPase
MRIVVASGKGGTGKTTVATSLALSLSSISPGGQPVLFLDCDVEAPNAHLFLRPRIDTQKEAVILLPQIDPAKCSACGKCVEVCQFHALAQIGKKILVFPQLCHGCGSCTLNCPEEAITETPNPIGMLEAGQTDTGIDFARGILTISEPMSTPIIQQLKKWKKSDMQQIVVLDAPPGASCPVVEAVRGSDFALLVTEPTPFGLHDLKQMTGILREMSIPAGVVINRDGIGNGSIEAYCKAENLPVLLRIPFDREIAEGTAKGLPLLAIYPEYQERFRKVFEQIKDLKHCVQGTV